MVDKAQLSWSAHVDPPGARSGLDPSWRVLSTGGRASGWLADYGSILLLELEGWQPHSGHTLGSGCDSPKQLNDGAPSPPFPKS